MKLASTLALLLAFAALTVPVSAEDKPDPKAEALRGLMAKFESKVVTVNWVTKTSAMGNEIETPGSATGVVFGDKGLVAVSAQPFNNPMGGLAGMFGGGRRGGGGGSGAQATGPEDFRVEMGKASVEALSVVEDKDTNLRFFAGKFEEGKAPAAIAWPEKVSVPALGEEVVILGCYDATLNHARFFKTARINSVIEENKFYGLDGSTQDCLGGLVVTYSGNVLGVIAQKNPEDTGTGGGGIGGILGGMSDPSKMLGNRVLMTPAVFAAVIKKAQDKMADPNFGKPPVKPAEKPAEKPADPKTEDPPVDTPPEKKHNWRGLTRVIAVDDKILKGKYGEAKGGIMVSSKPETDSMCAKAGLANGDLIVKVGETAIAADLTPDKFWDMIEKLDGSVKISVIRFGGKTYDLTIDTK